MPLDRPRVPRGGWILHRRRPRPDMFHLENRRVGVEVQGVERGNILKLKLMFGFDCESLLFPF